MRINSLLAAVQQPAEQLPQLEPVAKPITSDLTMLLGAIGALVAALIFWVIFIRGPKKHPEERNRKPIQANSNPRVTVTEDGRERHKKKKRHRRRDHRDRNPTLAQTGGLPPPRDPQASTPI